MLKLKIENTEKDHERDGEKCCYIHGGKYVKVFYHRLQVKKIIEEKEKLIKTKRNREK